MASTLHNFTIHRGLTFGGLRLMALDSSGNPVVIQAGSTGLLQARRTAGASLAFALDVSLGDEDGEILVDEVSDTDTAAFTAGEYAYDLVLIDDDDKAWGPFMHGTITVKDTISEPA
jgi:hypothetical protein